MIESETFITKAFVYTVSRSVPVATKYLNELYDDGDRQRAPRKRFSLAFANPAVGSTRASFKLWYGIEGGPNQNSVTCFR